MKISAAYKRRGGQCGEKRGSWDWDLEKFLILYSSISYNIYFRSLFNKVSVLLFNMSD